MTFDRVAKVAMIVGLGCALACLGCNKGDANDDQFKSKAPPVSPDAVAPATNPNKKMPGPAGMAGGPGAAGSPGMTGPVKKPN